MHHLTKVKLINKLNEEELKRGIKIDSSWHTKVNLIIIIVIKYKDSAYIHVGGLPFELSEGDIIIIFSQ